MTANQIAYAANQEQHRHNVATEDIAANANDIAAEKNRITESYQTRLNEIQSEYNATYLELQRSQGDRKLQLQEDLNRIEWLKTTIDQDYKQQMVEIGIRNSTVNEKAQAETERYQKRLNELGFSKNEIDAQVANIKEKMAEYEKYSIDQNVRIQDFNALVNKTRADNEYSINLINAEIANVRNEIEQQKVELQALKQPYENAGIVTHSIWEGVKAIAGFTNRR